MYTTEKEETLQKFGQMFCYWDFLKLILINFKITINFKNCY